MTGTIRTTIDHDFGELSHQQFEGVFRQLLGNLEGVEWAIRPEPIGHLGADAGTDIRVRELVRGRRGRTGTREWLAQAKRYERIGPAELRGVVDAAVPVGSAPPYALIVALACDVSRRGFDAFRAAAEGRGVQRVELWTRRTLNDLLNQPANARVASFYFGDGSAIQGTIPLPLALDRSPGRDLQLTSREEQLAALIANREDDLVIVGVAGTGKSRLAVELPGVRFVSLSADAAAVAESLRLDRPNYVVLDDAGLDLPRLEMLLELRREGHRFGIVATTWPDRVDDVRRALPGAQEIAVAPLERPQMDVLLRTLGIGNYYLRSWILDLAEGRPGWAVSLAGIAMRGNITEVLSGRALIAEVEPYLRRLNPAASAQVMTLLGVLAALGPIDLDTEMAEVDRFLGIGRAARAQLLREAAAVGMVEIESNRLRVAPSALCPALVAHVFFGGTAPLSVRELIRAWPSRAKFAARRVIEAAAAGSAAARREVDVLVPDTSALATWGSYEILDEFVALDEAGARRAIRETTAVTDGGTGRQRIFATALRRFVLPEAVGELLTSSIGDARPEHPNPDHPLRILGELGRRIDPHGQTSFEARALVLTAANIWFDQNAAPERGEVWARLAAHLLDPHVEGAYVDTGSPNTVHLPGGVESAERILELRDRIWPEISSRLARLDTRGLVAFSAAVRELGEVKRRFPVRGDVVPSVEQADAATALLNEILLELDALAITTPGLQLALHRIRRDIGVGARQPMDPEFRLLAFGWHYRSHRDLHLGHAIDRLVDRWLAERPAALLERVARWSREAALAGTDLQPAGFEALARFADKTPALDEAVEAGIAAGLRLELEPLMQRALARAPNASAWFGPALAGALRGPALAAALAPGANPDAARLAVESLTASDAWIVETVLIRHGHAGHGEVSRSLLRHPDPAIHAEASLAFSLEDDRPPRGLPVGWYDDWKAAFVDAAIADDGRNYDLGRVLSHLVDSDPELVATWLEAQVLAGARMWRLGFVRALNLARLPTPIRDRILRAAPPDARSELLRLLVGDDRAWADELLRDAVVSPTDLLLALANRDHDGLSARQALDSAPVLRAHGGGAGAVVTLTDRGWMGSESAHYAELRTDFESQPADADPGLEAIRQEAIAMLRERESTAADAERRERITGRIT